MPSPTRFFVNFKTNNKGLPVLIRISSYPDDTLLHLLSQGDKEAFEELYHRYWASMYDAAYKRLQNIEQSKDIVQDIFTDLWTRRNKLHIEKPEAYLHTAVRFQVYKTLTRSKTSPFFELFESIASSPFSADSKVKEGELAALAKAWLDSLPAKRKEIFILHFVQNLSTKEIADRLQISQKTVQNQLGIARDDFRNRVHPSLIVLFSIAELFN